MMSYIKQMSIRFKYYWSEKNPFFLTRLMFFFNFGKILSLKNPKDINEKLQYLKLYVYSNNSIVTQCVDKYRVKDYLKQKDVDGLFVAKNYSGSMTTGKELIDIWQSLPKSFVIKCNHGCGFNIIVNDKDDADMDDIIETVETWLKDDQWKLYCEPQYRNVDKCFFIEEHLGADVEAYKFYCFNGEPEVVYVSSKGDTGIQDYYLDYYDKNWNWMNISLYGHENLGPVTRKPSNYYKMIEISKILSSDFPFVRVDLYEVGDKVYFSELTFVPTGGNMKIKPRSVLDNWGEMLDISKYN